MPSLKGKKTKNTPKKKKTPLKCGSQPLMGLLMQYCSGNDKIPVVN